MLKTRKSQVVFTAIVLLAITVINVLCCSLLFPRVNNSKHEADKVSKASQEDINYDDFSLQIEDIEDLLTGEISGVVYFGRDTCPNCLLLNATLSQFLCRNKYTLYKFDTDTWCDSTHFQEVLNLYHIKQIPALVEIDENGNAINRFFVDGLTANELEAGLEDFFSTAQRNG